MYTSDGETSDSLLTARVGARVAEPISRDTWTRRMYMGGNYGPTQGHTDTPHLRAHRSESSGLYGDKMVKAKLVYCAAFRAQ